MSTRPLRRRGRRRRPQRAGRRGVPGPGRQVGARAGAAGPARRRGGQPAGLRRASTSGCRAYSYLVSLLPDRIVADLGLAGPAARPVGRLLHAAVRATAGTAGLLVERDEGPATADVLPRS